MKERSLVFFTLLMQGSVGLCLFLNIQELGKFGIAPESFLFSRIAWSTGFLLAVVGLTSSFFHLKVPLHAWRALSNLKTSWLSREILFASLYTLSMFSMAILQLFPEMENLRLVLSGFALATGLAMIFCMGSAYRLRTVKFWDSAQTLVTFYTSVSILGLLIYAILDLAYFSESDDCIFCLDRSGGILAVLLLLNLYFSFSGYNRLISETNESFVQIKKILIFRSIAGILAIILSILIYFSDLDVAAKLTGSVVITAFLSEFLGRALFYAAQVPTGVYLLNE